MNNTTTNKTPASILTQQGKPLTARYYTLGCKLNFSETSTFRRRLMELGVNDAADGTPADICIINTCSVTGEADHKCRQIIHRMVRENPDAFMVVTGCYAQLESKQVAAIDGVDLVLGSNEKASLVDYIMANFTVRKERDRRDGDSESSPRHLHKFHHEKTRDIKTFQPSCSRGNRTRYFLKVQDGCNYFCTYCTIPYARGFSRNPSISSLVNQAEQAAAEGGKEIVITGVNIGDFGESTGEKFIDLVKALDGVDGIKRFRISSLEPDLISDELIEYCAQSRAFMPHFHIPLQSGSDEVLRLMHRRYDTTLFAHKIHLIKRLMPDAFIGVDVMVGCRGERPEYFEDTYRFLEELPVTQLHVFPYSERPGTAALRIPYVVEQTEKKLRAHRLLELSATKTHDFYKAHIGSKSEVLFERAHEGKPMHGFTRNYIRVELPAEKASESFDNMLVNVSLGDFNADGTALLAENIERTENH